MGNVTVGWERAVEGDANGVGLLDVVAIEGLDMDVGSVLLPESPHSPICAPCPGCAGILPCHSWHRATTMPRRSIRTWFPASVARPSAACRCWVDAYYIERRVILAIVGVIGGTRLLCGIPSDQCADLA